MPSKKYWDNRYLTKETGWDIGEISSPIKVWFDHQNDKSKKILIPGAGSGFEAGYAYNIGFKNIYYLDFSAFAAEKFKAKYPDFPSDQIIYGDFFSLSNHASFFDVIIEQTFFCAIAPNKRAQYVNKVHELLKHNGTIIGLLFNTEFKNPHPPFGGTLNGYKALFNMNFKILKLENCYNSISSRANSELWISMKKIEKKI
jgi:methyl halide transferase